MKTSSSVGLGSLEMVIDATCVVFVVNEKNRSGRCTVQYRMSFCDAEIGFLPNMLVCVHLIGLKYLI